MALDLIKKIAFATIMQNGVISGGEDFIGKIPKDVYKAVGFRVTKKNGNLWCGITSVATPGKTYFIPAAAAVEAGLVGTNTTTKESEPLAGASAEMERTKDDGLSYNKIKSLNDVAQAAGLLNAPTGGGNNNMA